MEWIIIAWLAVVTVLVISILLFISQNNYRKDITLANNIATDARDYSLEVVTMLKSLSAQLGYTYEPPTTTEKPARWVKKNK